MGLVYNAFKRNRAQLHVPRVLKERKQTPQPVFISRPIRSIGRFYGKLPQAVKLEARKLRYQGHRDRTFLEAEYHRLERISRYANYL